jgi:hypothetical protein
MEKNIVYKLHALEAIKFVEKCDKYVATLQVHNHAKVEVWLSPKQAENLNKSFGVSDYSTKHNTVFAVLAIDGNRTRFIWAATNDHGKKYLLEKFNASEPESDAETEEEATENE